MPKQEKGKFQSWNKRSRKWVCFEDGMICGMSSEKFEDIRVEKDKPVAPVGPAPADPGPADPPCPHNPGPAEDDNPFWLM